MSWSKQVAYCFSKHSDLEKMSKEKEAIDDLIPDMKRPHAPDGGIYSIEQTLDR